MRIKILLLMTALTFVGQAIFAKEIKHPDSYAYTRGVEAFNDKQYNEALEWMNREISEHPDNGYARTYIAILHFENNEFGKSLTSIDESMKHIPKKDNEWRAMNYGVRAKIYLALEDTIKALDDLNQAIKIDDKKSSLYTQRAQIYYEQKKYPLSDADYNKIIELDRGDVIGYMGLGRNANDQGKWDDAIAQFDYVLKLAPDFSQGYAYRAESYLGKEDWTRATDDIIRALDIDGDDEAFQLMTDLPDEATEIIIPKLKIQMAKQASNIFWPFCLYSIYYEKQDYQNALEYAEKANQLDPSSFMLRRIAMCHKYLGNLDLALDCLNQALNINPTDTDLLDYKATILRNMGKLEEAVEVRNQSLKANPGEGLNYFSIAEDKMNLGRYGEAVEDYNTANALFPILEELSFFLVSRGDAYNFIGQTEKAVKDYKKVVELNKDDEKKTSLLALAYSGLGEYGLAEETMMEIIRNESGDNTDNYYNLACIYARQGDNVKAIEAFKEAIDNGYDDFIEASVDYKLRNLHDYPPFVQLLEENMPKVTQIAIVDADNETDETSVYETVEIPFTKEGGVTKVKCTINGLPLHFVFDTGAADVTMSMVEANFMLKNDYIKPDDIIGLARYIDANGDISEGTVVNLKNVNFGGLELDNVRASVVRNQKAPLLLGQSVLGRLGKIEIDNNNQKLKITHKMK